MKRDTGVRIGQIPVNLYNALTSLPQVSKACTSICQWVRAMHKYHFVAKSVAPKREALRIAQEELAETQKILDAAIATLHEVEQGIATLQAKYEDTMRKKDELQFKTNECEARLVRADKVSVCFPLSRFCRSNTTVAQWLELQTFN